MATTEQKRSFITMCANIIRDNYDGNPLALQSFLDKVDLIKDLTDDNLSFTFIAFVKSKLEGKAREALPENINNIDDIKMALKSKIRPENSKVVAGKIAALQVRNNNFSDFAKETEELADALERSLVIEGITKVKAHEMAIEQTVNICRLNAKSNLVKSILAFAEPKDVIAKLIIEQTNETNERQVLAVQTRTSNVSNFPGGNNSNSFSNRNRFNNNFSNRGNNQRRYNNSSRGFSNYQNNDHNNYRRNGHINRGNTRYNNSNHNRNRTVNARTLHLNGENPQQEMLGDVN